MLRHTGYRCEVDLAAGLETLAGHELSERLGDRSKPCPQVQPRPGLLGFDYKGDLHALLDLRMAIAAYLVRHYAVPRPRALLGDQHFRALLEQIQIARALLGEEYYRTVHVSAAGAESPVMKRLKDEIARHTGLALDAAEGDLLIRIRPAVYATEGWEASVRLSPRPLATRPWRVCNMEGALNATVAHAIVLLSQPAPGDSFLNVACGSGTLLIERRDRGPARRLIGADIDAGTLACAQANVAASGYAQDIELQPWDARALPLPDRSVDVLCADLPFGHLVGSHGENQILYPAILHEAARVARPAARFVIITHEVRLMTGLLQRSSPWSKETDFPVFLGNLPARIFVLRRQAL